MGKLAEFYDLPVVSSDALTNQLVASKLSSISITGDDVLMAVDDKGQSWHRTTNGQSRYLL